MGADTISRGGKTVANPMALSFASSSRKERIAGKVKKAASAEDERIRRLKLIQSPVAGISTGEQTTGRKLLADTDVKGRKTLLGQ